MAETLASSTRDLASSLQRDQVLQRLVEHARRLTSSDLSYIAVQEGTAHEYRICAESGAWTDTLLGRMVGAGRGLGEVALARPPVRPGQPGEVVLNDCGFTG